MWNFSSCGIFRVEQIAGSLLLGFAQGFPFVLLDQVQANVWM